MLWRTLLVAALLAGGIVQSAAAQVPPRVELVSADYDGGRVLASLQVSGDQDVGLANLTAFVDGSPRAVEPVSREGSQPISVVVVIDVSGSMVGQPIASARQAASNLVDRLSPTDRVAVVAFADDEQVLPLASDRGAAKAMIAKLQAKGGTHLYAAIQRASALLTQAPAGPRILVLLSDGEDDTGVTAPGRGASIAAVRASGARTYTFGLGKDVDAAFLSELSQSTSGAFSAVADDSALGSALLNLRDRLGRTLGFNIAVPALPAGEHTVTLRARVGGTDVTVSRPLRVVTDGTLRARTVPQPDGSNPMVVDVEWVSPQSALKLQAVAAGRQLPVLTAPDRVVVDPWRFTPGDLNITLLAMSGGLTVARGATTVQVPALRPMLTLRRDGTSSPAVYMAQGRVQDDEHSSLVAQIDGVEAGRSQQGELRLPVHAGKTLVIRLEDGTGALMATQSIAAPRGFDFAVPLFVLVPALLFGLAGWRIVQLKLRTHANREVTRLAHSRRRALLAEPIRGDVARGTLLVRAPDGDERRYAIGPRPLSLGRSTDCDVVIDSDDVWGLHALFSALGAGEFQVHGIAPPAASFGEVSHDEWLVVRAGEQLSIGGHVVTMLTAESELEPLGSR